MKAMSEEQIKAIVNAEGEVQPERVQFRNPIEDLGFARMHHAIGLDVTLSDGAYRTLAILHYFWQQKTDAWPSVETLAQLRGISERQVERQLKELVDKGLITRQRRAGTSSVTYLEDPPSHYSAIATGILEERNEKKRRKSTSEKAPSVERETSPSLAPSETPPDVPSECPPPERSMDVPAEGDKNVTSEQDIAGCDKNVTCECDKNVVKRRTIEEEPWGDERKTLITSTAVRKKPAREHPRAMSKSRASREDSPACGKKGKGPSEGDGVDVNLITPTPVESAESVSGIARLLGDLFGVELGDFPALMGYARKLLGWAEQDVGRAERALTAWAERPRNREYARVVHPMAVMRQLEVEVARQKKEEFVWTPQY